MVAKGWIFFLRMRGQHGLAQRNFIVQRQVTNHDDDVYEEEEWRTKMAHSGEPYRKTKKHR